MENTLENKAKFFALYWGQEILSYQIKATSLVCVGDSRIHKDDILELKPLSQITDEDAVEVAKIMDVKDPDFWTNEFSKYRKEDQCNYSEVGRDYISYFFRKERYSLNLRVWYIKQKLIIAVGDFLRSKGYALPYLNLSVEKQIEYGWIKLTD